MRQWTKGPKHFRHHRHHSHKKKKNNNSSSNNNNSSSSKPPLNDIWSTLLYSSLLCSTLLCSARLYLALLFFLRSLPLFPYVLLLPLLYSTLRFSTTFLLSHILAATLAYCALLSTKLRLILNFRLFLQNSTLPNSTPSKIQTNPGKIIINSMQVAKPWKAWDETDKSEIEDEPMISWKMIPNSIHGPADFRCFDAKWKTKPRRISDLIQQSCSSFIDFIVTLKRIHKKINARSRNTMKL